jgi:hypothetical protein
VKIVSTARDGWCLSRDGASVCCSGALRAPELLENPRPAVRDRRYKIQTEALPIETIYYVTDKGSLHAHRPMMGLDMVTIVNVYFPRGCAPWATIFRLLGPLRGAARRISHWRTPHVNAYTACAVGHIPFAAVATQRGTWSLLNLAPMHLFSRPFGEARGAGVGVKVPCRACLRTVQWVFGSEMLVTGK